MLILSSQGIFSSIPNLDETHRFSKQLTKAKHKTVRNNDDGGLSFGKESDDGNVAAETIREQTAFEVLTNKDGREERFNLLVNKNNLTQEYLSKNIIKMIFF